MSNQTVARRKRYAAGYWREIHMKTMKKLWLMVAALSVTTLLCVISASACTKRGLFQQL